MEDMQMGWVEVSELIRSTALTYFLSRQDEYIIWKWKAEK